MNKAATVSVLCMLVTGFFVVSGAMADESWKLPMAQKEKIIEQNILERHNILGLYPSQVKVPLDGGPVDNTTLGIGNLAHSVCWTANYLAGASYRYAFLKKSGAPEWEVVKAKTRADDLFEAVYRCQLVTGVRGLQARGYAIGHGESYEERWHGQTRDEWHQGAGEYKNLRWRGDPSHHNYSDSVHGLAQYYDLAAEGVQKQRCREAIDALVSWWVDNDLKIDKLDRSRRPVPILGFTDGKTLNTRVMMAIAGAKVAYHATGKEKFNIVYQKLIDQFSVRGLKQFKCEKDFDDSEHVFCHLENLFRIEKDPELLAAYRVVADALWAHHKDSAQSLFTYIYISCVPDTPEREKVLKDAMFRLQTWPTDMMLRPTMNSLRSDLKQPYPTYLCRWDNEYIWKGNLLGLDGWPSRTVTRLVVPAEDTMVSYAIDEGGDLYQSRDGAATAAGWRYIGQGLSSPVRAVDAGHRVRMVFAACDDGFYISPTGGHTWQRLPVPADGGRPVDIKVDLNNPYVLYAVTDKGVYQSRDFGEEYVGRSWQVLSEGLPPGSQMSFHLALGNPGRIYAVVDGVFFTRRIDQGQWQRGGSLSFGGLAQPYPWITVDPTDPNHAVCGVWTSYLGGKSMLRKTTDGGLNWSHDIQKWWQEENSYEQVQELIASLLPGRINQPVIYPSDPSVMFSAGDRKGVLISTDGGRRWRGSNKGMDIPVANSVMAPRNTDWVFAGTPAGLAISKDGGKTWEDGHLCLQFIKNTRRELGGAAYIDAYWRARYYGFIDEKTANRPWQGQ